MNNVLFEHVVSALFLLFEKQEITVRSDLVTALTDFEKCQIVDSANYPAE